MIQRLLRPMGPGLGSLAIAAALLLPSPTAAAQAPQGRGTPAPPTNLQVLPKDISRADLLLVMRGYARGLGVECNYCHVQEGRGGRNDMASDEKPPKKTARVMIRMVDHVNEMLASELGKPAADVVKVECATCHRGSAIPEVEAPAPAAAAR
jgi:hypothetical protein